MKQRNSSTAVTVALASAALAATVSAQDLNAYMNQQMAITNQRIAQALQQNNQLTQQINQAQTAAINRGMQDPNIQAADQSGMCKYWAAAGNGYWYPLAR